MVFKTGATHVTNFQILPYKSPILLLHPLSFDNQEIKVGTQDGMGRNPTHWL